MQQDKITDLPELATAAADDVLEITDVSTSTSNKVQAKNLAAAVVGGMSDGAITPEKRSGGYHVAGIALSAGTGTKTLSGFGFRPKLVRFTLLVASTGGTFAGYGVACSDGSAIHQHSTAGAAASAGYRNATSNTSCLLGVSTVATVFTGQLVSFDEDGVTVNVTLDNSGYRSWIVEAYA